MTTPPSTLWHFRLPRDRTLSLGHRPKVMGVVNITPDSFSDGGLWLDPAAAVDHGLRLVEEGAEILDLGAESTRPGGGVYGAGAGAVPADDELRRLLPVLKELARHSDVPLSVDTRKGEVARRALEGGADLINDVGGLADPDLAAAVAESGCPVVAMHSRGELSTMQRAIRFDDVAREVRDELAAIGARARDAGIDEAQLIFDPGIGFGKTARQNLELVGRLDGLRSLGRPILLGASRKSFIGEITGTPPRQRLAGSLAAAAWAAQLGASIVRAHDVAATSQFLKVWNAIDLARGGDELPPPPRRSP